MESFLKMFYLIFGQAYSRDYMSQQAYNKMCVNKDTKIHMPKAKVDERLDTVALSEIIPFPKKCSEPNKAD